MRNNSADVKIGVASYKGNSKKLIAEFGLGVEHPMYNCEGFYVRSKDGKQVVINNRNWNMIENKR